MKHGLVLIFLILLFSSIFAHQVKEMTFEQVDDIALRNAKNLWGNVFADNPIPLYDRNGVLQAWQYNFCKGKPFPTKDALTQRIKNEGSDLFDCKWAKEEFACMTLGARTDKPVILAYADGLSYEYSYLAEIERLAKSRLMEKYQTISQILISLGNRWSVVSDGESEYYVKAYPPSKILSREEFLAATEFPEYPPKNIDFSQEWDEAISGNTIDRSVVYIPYEDYMPSIRWSYGCSPTAGATVAAYWDNVSMFRQGDFSRLVGSTHSRLEPNNGQLCHHVPDALPIIAEKMDTSDDGSTMPWNVNDGMEDFFTYKGHDSWCYNNDYIVDYFFNIHGMYSDLMTEINWGQPTIMNVIGHTVVGFGFSTSGNMVAIHNSNEPSIDNWHISEFWQLVQVHPRSEDGCAINIIHPDGGHGWVENGNDFETYYAGSIMEISWLSDNVPNTTVEILISPVSDIDVNDQWYEIAAAAPNTGNYSWLIPSDWEGDDYRIVLQVLDADRVIQGVDGSYGSFTILPGGTNPNLQDGLATVVTISPTYYNLSLPYPAWSAAGIRIPFDTNSSNNAQSTLTLFTPDFNTPLASSASYGRVNWIAIDKNHEEYNFLGLKTELAPYTSNNSLEWEAGMHSLSLGINPSTQWLSGDVVKMWDVQLNPGTYNFTLRQNHSGDFGIGLCSSQGGVNYITPATLIAFGDRYISSTSESFIVTITQADTYGFIAWANLSFSGTIEISISDPGTWTGAVDTNWHNHLNWATGSVPNADADITIPSGITYYPAINSPATCANLLIAYGATINLFSELTITGNATISGSIRFNGTNPTLSCSNDIIWTSTSHIHELTEGIINVAGNWIAQDGCAIDMNWSTVNFIGDSPARIQINSSAAAFKHLNISKSNGTRVLIDEETTNTVVIRGNLIVNSGAVLKSTCDYEIKLSGNLQSFGGMIFENCSLKMFNRFSAQSISLSGANRLFSLEIDNTMGVTLSSDLSLYGSMWITSGTFDISNCQVSVYGSWYNDAGPGTLLGSNHRVIFNGSYNEVCYETDFNILELNKINSSELRVPIGKSLNCQSYDWSNGSLRVLDEAEFIANDLADSSILGRYYLDGGTIDLHQDGNQSVDLNADLYIADGNFNIYGGSNQNSRWGQSRSIIVSMQGGILDYKDTGILLASNSYNVQDIITDSTIRTVGDFIVQRPGFNPSNAILEMYGDSASSLRVNSPSKLSSLVVNKTSRRDGDDRQERTTLLTVDSNTNIGNYCEIQAGTLRVNGAQLSIAGYLNISSGIQMDSDDDIIYVRGSLNFQESSNTDNLTGGIFQAENTVFVYQESMTLPPEVTIIMTNTYNLSQHFDINTSNVSLGTIIIEKINGPVQCYGNFTLSLSGNLIIKPGATFVVTNHPFNVAGMIDIWYGGTFSPSGNAQINANNLYNSGLLNLASTYVGTISVANTFLQYASGSLALHGGTLKLDKAYSGTNYSFGGTTSMSGGTLQITNNGMQVGTSGFTFSGGTIKLGTNFIAQNPDTFQANQGTIEMIGSRAASLIIDNGNYLPNLVISKTEATGAIDLGSDITVNGTLTVSTGQLRVNHHKLSVQSHITITQSGYLYCNNADDEIWAAKDWINNGGPDNFIEGLGAVVFCGSWGQLRNSETFYNMRVHCDFPNPDTGGVSGDYYITINVLHDLDITAGKLSLGEGTAVNVTGNMNIAGNGFSIFSNPSTPASTVTIGGNLNVDDTLLNLRFTNLLLHGALSASSSSEIVVSFSTFVNDAPYTGTWQQLAGKWTIGRDSYAEFTNNNVQMLSGNQLSFYGDNGYGTLKLGRNYHAVYNDATYHLGLGYIEFIGDQPSLVYMGGNNQLPSITINKDNAEVTLATPVIVHGSVRIESGVFNTNSFPLELHGQWTNYSGTDAYLPGTSVITLKNSSSTQAQGISGTQSFYKVIVNHPTSSNISEFNNIITILNKLEVQSGGLVLGATHILNAMDDVIISEGAFLELEYMSDLYCYKGLIDHNPVIVNSQTQKLGFIAHSNSTLWICGEENQSITFASPFIPTGEFILSKLSGSFMPVKPMLIHGFADLRYGAWHYGQSGLSHSFLSGLRILNSSSFTDNTGLLIFEGDEDATLQVSGYANFKDITISKSSGRTVGGTLSLLSDLTMNTAGTISVYKGTFDLNSYTLQTKGNLDISADAKLVIGAGAKLEMDNGSTLNIYEDGALESVGTADSLATITKIDGIGYRYHLNVHPGATIGGEYTVYEYMGTNGINIMNGAIIDPEKAFNYCTFGWGYEGGSLLTVANDQIVTIDHAYFPTHYITNTVFNVSKTNDQGSIQFTNETGGWSGTLHENDIYNRVNWAADLPLIMANPPSLSFGDVLWSQSSDYRGLIIQNGGSAMLTGNIQVPEGFSVVFARESTNGNERQAPKGEDTPLRDLLYFSVPAGGSRIYHVYFQPEEPISYSAALIITHNAASAPVQINLSGQGIGPMISASHSYYNVDISPGQDDARTLTINNGGVSPLSLMAYVSSAMNPSIEILNCGFEDTFPPSGWDTSMISNTGSTPPQWFAVNFAPHVTNGPHNGDQLAYFNSYNCQANSQARLESPILSLANINAPTLSFWIYHENSWNDRDDRIQVQVSSGSRNWIDLGTAISRYNASQTGWIQHTLSLWDFMGQESVQIGFLGISAYGNDICIDDVVISGTYQLPLDWIQINGDNMVMTEVLAGNELPLEITVDSTDIPNGWYYNSINISSNDPQNFWLSIPFNVRIGNPDFEINPSYLSFPNVQIGETDSLDFAIINSGAIGLEGSVTAPDGFWIEAVGGFRHRDGNTLDFYAYPGIAASFRVYFNPTEAMDYAANVTIVTNTGTPAYLPINGSGISLPEITTLAVDNIGAQTALANASILNSGNQVIQECGICWNTSGNPSLEDYYLASESSEDEFSVPLSNLIHGTQYFVKAYATNALGTAYGEEQSFTTLWPELIVSTDSLPDFGLVPVGTESSAQFFTISGNNLVDMVMLSSIGNFRIACHPDSVFGTQLNLYPNANTLPETPIYVKFIPQDTGFLQDIIVPLTAGGSNSDISLSGTGVTTASVETATAVNVSSTSAEINSRITSDGFAPVIACGVCFSTSIEPTLDDPHTDEGAQDGWFVSSLTELESNTRYFARSYTQNLAGVEYGNTLSFVTQANPQVSVNSTFLDGFGYIAVGSISEMDTLIVSAQQMMDELIVSAPEGFELSLFPTNRSFSPSLNLSGDTNGNILETIVYVRFAPLSSGNLSDNIILSSTGMDNIEVLVGGMGITLPAVETISATEITANSALADANILHDGFSEILQQGFCLGTQPDPDLSAQIYLASEMEPEFNADIDNLQDNTQYYIRAFATNSVGTAYGETISFTTPLGSLAQPQNIRISLQDGEILLSWDPVVNANSYKIYRNTDPHSQNWGMPIAISQEPSWIDTSGLGTAFYKVIASTD